MNRTWWRFALPLVFSLGMSSLGRSATAAVGFTQQEVDQNRFITVAAPAGRIGYQLVILEQIKDTQPCWREAGGSPSSVDMLLLNFDFTGICGRSLDSNGYSLRLDGQDYALQYSLRVLQQGNDLVLAAVRNGDRNAPMLIIGHTNGISNGFSRIVLNPGWRLTRRIYNGRPLGHLYLTNDQPLNVLVAAAPGAGSAASGSVPPAANGSPVSASPFPPPVVSGAGTSAAPPPLSVPTPPPASAPIIPPAAPAPRPTLPPLVTNRPPASGSGRSTPPRSPVSGQSTTASGAVQIPVPPPVSTQVNRPPVASPPAVSPSASSSSATATVLPTPSRSSRSPIVVPTGPVEIPVPPPASQASGANRGRSSVVVPTDSDPVPTPAPQTTALLGYRVIVPITNEQTQARVKQLIPDAFPVRYNGQLVMQAGQFPDRDSANFLRQQLSQSGIQAIVVANDQG